MQKYNMHQKQSEKGQQTIKHFGKLNRKSLQVNLTDKRSMSLHVQFF